MKPNKLMALILSGAMAVSMLAGCGGGSGSGGSSKAMEEFDGKAFLQYGDNKIYSVRSSPASTKLCETVIQNCKKIDTSEAGEAGALIAIIKSIDRDTGENMPVATIAAYISIDKLKEARIPEIRSVVKEIEITGAGTDSGVTTITPSKKVTTVSEYAGALSAYAVERFDGFYDGYYEAQVTAEITKSGDGKVCWAVAMFIMPKTESAK